MKRSSRDLITIVSILAITPFIYCAEEQRQWPYNLPPGAKYFPEDEALVRRSEIAQEKLKKERPIGIKKMALDEGDMFFPHYWTFASDQQEEGDDSAAEDIDPIRRTSTASGSEISQYDNMTAGETIWPVFALHTEEDVSRNPLLARFLPEVMRRQFDKRFQCPTGTFACTSIDRPNSCCANGETCQLIQDTGLGDVGCCAADQTCGGELSGCQNGYTSCPNNPGGGCCMPGYACYSVGCAISQTDTVVITPTVTETVGSSSSLPPVTLTSTTTVIVAPSGQPTATTTTPSSRSTPTPTKSSTSPDPTTSVVVVTTTSSQASLTCSTGFRSCPASLGGGCCPTGSACGSPTCPALSSTQSLVPPVRGTTDTTETTSATSSTSAPYSSCPTGFYACSAYYVGGCCRTGRDCSSTSCPAIPSTTLIDTRSLTVVAPTGSGISASVEGLTGTCATGWALCPSSAGGGCCPSGYACGTSCTVQASASQTGYGQLVGKVQPSAAGRGFDISVAYRVLQLTTVMMLGYLLR